jgi:hypothetical protein
LKECIALKKENLRDNMTNTELILNMLAEASTRDISATVKPKDFEESKKSSEAWRACCIGCTQRVGS